METKKQDVLGIDTEKDWEILEEDKTDGLNYADQHILNPATNGASNLRSEVSVEQGENQSASTFWKEDADSEGSTTLSCEDVIAQSESILRSKAESTECTLDTTRLLNLEASQVEVRKTTIEASEQQEIEQEYKLFAPVRLAVTNNTAAMKEAYAMVANSFRCGLSNYVDQLSWYTNQSNALSMGFLLLSCSLAYCIHDNMKLKKQMERRGEIIQRLLSVVYFDYMKPKFLIYEELFV